MCMCLAMGGLGGERDESIWFGLYQSCGNRAGIGSVSVFWVRWCGWVGGLDQVWRGGVVL